MKTLLLAAALFAMAASAQTAKVIELSPSDAAKAKALHEAVQAAQKAESDFHAIVEERYVLRSTGDRESVCDVPSRDPGQDIGNQCSTAHSGVLGWAFGFEYSEDFRYIVPAQAAQFSAPALLNWVTPASLNLFEGHQSQSSFGCAMEGYVNGTGGDRMLNDESIRWGRDLVASY